jgi:hypothetical protein
MVGGRNETRTPNFHLRLRIVENGFELIGHEDEGIVKSFASNISNSFMFQNPLRGSIYSRFDL